MKPWDFNGEGECRSCGKKMGFYDSKYIEVAEPHRFMCAFPAPYGCGHEKHGDVDETKWYYWTDG